MTLSWNRYGKARVRLVKVRRQRDPHELVDVTLDIQLEGAFEPVYVDGDNQRCLATDTMKNTVYAFARSDDDRAHRALCRAAGRALREAAGRDTAREFRRPSSPGAASRWEVVLIRTRSNSPAASSGRPW